MAVPIYVVAGLFLLCFWSAGWGCRYFYQMKEWKRRATMSEYMLKMIHRELKADLGQVSITTEAQLDDVLVDLETKS